MDENCYNNLYTYLRTGELPGDMSKNEVDSFRRRAKSFIVKDGLLYYVDKKIKTNLQV